MKLEQMTVSDYTNQKNFHFGYFLDLVTIEMELNNSKIRFFMNPPLIFSEICNLYQVTFALT